MRPDYTQPGANLYSTAGRGRLPATSLLPTPLQSPLPHGGWEGGPYWASTAFPSSSQPASCSPDCAHLPIYSQGHYFNSTTSHFVWMIISSYFFLPFYFLFFIAFQLESALLQFVHFCLFICLPAATYLFAFMYYNYLFSFTNFAIFSFLWMQKSMKILVGSPTVL